MPSTSIDYDLAEALTTQLAALLAPTPVEATADPTVRREAITALAVRVIPAAYTQRESEWRDVNDEERRVHVSIVGPAEAIDLASVKAGLILADQVKALWAEGGPLRNLVLVGHTWKGPLKQDPLYRQDVLLQSNLFVATVQATYYKTY